MKRIFVSGPYSNGDTVQNVKIAMDISNDLIEAGYAPYCPHLTHFLHLNHYQPYETWLSLDLQYLEVCDGLIRFPGESNGADKEVIFAREHDIPVFFDLEELNKHFVNKEREV